ncbi:MAG: hypothetical protein KDK25_03455 [Leptospiraceae bacterium]|nr:hypothetical protein [Leptospiraceae bacterium]
MAAGEINIHLLMRRMAGCPSELYESPGETVVPLAVVQDTVFHLGGPALAPSIRKEIKSMKASGRISFVLLACYILSDPIFASRKDLLPAALELLSHGFIELSAVARASDFVLSTDRREEMVRLCLNSLGLLPEGEKKEMAANRLEALDTVRRVSLMKKATELRKRQEELRKAMERKAAEEAASKWSRE